MSRIRPRSKTMAMLAAVALVATACGDDDDERLGERRDGRRRDRDHATRSDGF